MARKFLWIVAILTMLVIAGFFAMRIFQDQLSRIAFVPSTAFEKQTVMADNAYDDPKMWFSGPVKAGPNPSLWLPRGAAPDHAAVSDEGARPDTPVFFIHPTSYLVNDHWNAPLDDPESQERAKLFIKSMASPFAAAGPVWAPRYRQAAFGAFLTDQPEAGMALDAAYRDIELAFNAFLKQAGDKQPIILAGHSQGAFLLTRLLNERVAGTPLAKRIVAAYVVGWPVSMTADIPALGLPACTEAEQTGCILSWQSYAEPADYSRVQEVFDAMSGFAGMPRKGTKMLCTNPVTGRIDDSAAAAQNEGTLVPDEGLKGGELMKGVVPARCDLSGFLLIGDPPDLGPYVLPGNNYHVYDIPLFWRNVRTDVERRARAFGRPPEIMAAKEQAKTVAKP